jgi:hypothetical protein
MKEFNMSHSILASKLHERISVPSNIGFATNISPDEQGGWESRWQNSPSGGSNMSGIWHKFLVTILVTMCAFVALDATAARPRRTLIRNAALVLTTATSHAAVVNATLPDAPALLRDVHLVEDDGTGMYRFTHPTVPALRTSNDGRVAVDLKKRRGNVAFYLFAPERETAYPDAWAAGVRMEALKQNGTMGSYGVPDANLHGAAAGSTHWHTTICDPGTSPVACNNEDCYSLVVYSVIEPTGAARVELWKKDVTVYVANPRTATASIRTIDTSAAPVLARTINGPRQFFEPTFTADGRLLVARFNGATVNIDGFNESTELVYFADPNGSNQRCNVTSWDGPHRITYAPSDPNMRGRYGIADQPMRDAENNVIPAGRDLRVTYPWIDRKGNNVFFTTIGATLYYWDAAAGAIAERYPASCIATQTGCTEPLAEADLGEAAGHEYTDNTRGLAFLGRWSNGKTVLLDNRLNNIDYGLPRDEPHQRMLALYSNALFQSVRVGTGRDNGGSGAPIGTSLNATVIDSLENLFNHDPHATTSAVRDVVWRVNMGKASAEVAFDDYVDSDVLIYSDMSASVTWDGSAITDRMKYWDGFVQTTATRGSGFPVNQEIHVQNAATGAKWNAPTHGALLGGARIEPVALGGIEGKGVWLDGAINDAKRDRIEYTTSNQPTQPSAWFAGIFVDPRFGDDGVRRRLLTFPDGTRVSLDGLSTLVLRKGPNASAIALPAGHLPQGAWSHLSFVLGTTEIDVYLDGYLLASTNWGVTNLVRNGTMAVGGAPAEEQGQPGAPPPHAFRGWIDEMKLIAYEPNPEVICNHARGTLIGWNEVAAPVFTDPTWIAVAALYPASSHTAVSARLATPYEKYACYKDYASLLEWSKNLHNVPPNAFSVRQSLLALPTLHFGAARPDMSTNAFCVTCHQSTITSLSSSALTAGVSPMQLDLRRQPMQPPRYISGNVPASYVWPNNLPASATAAPLNTYLDQWVYP